MTITNRTGKKSIRLCVYKRTHPGVMTTEFCFLSADWIIRFLNWDRNPQHPKITRGAIWNESSPRGNCTYIIVQGRRKADGLCRKEITHFSRIFYCCRRGFRRTCSAIDTGQLRWKIFGEFCNTERGGAGSTGENWGFRSFPTCLRAWGRGLSLARRNVLKKILGGCLWVVREGFVAEKWG